MTPKAAANKGKRSKAAPMAADKPIKEEFPSSKALGKRKASEASKASTVSATSDDEDKSEEEPTPKKTKIATRKK